MRSFIGFLMIPSCLLFGCGSTVGEGGSEQSAAITNGAADPGHPAVVAVTFIWPKANGKLGAVSCTGRDLPSRRQQRLRSHGGALPSAVAGWRRSADPSPRS